MDNPDKWLEKFLAALKAERAQRAAERAADRREWAAQRKADREADRQAQAKRDAEQAKRDAEQAKRDAEQAKRDAEWEKRQAVLDARMGKVSSDFANLAANQGTVVEEEFGAAVKAAKGIGGVKATRVRVNFGDSNREYDVVVFNGKTVVVVEVKHKLDAPDVSRFARGALPDFARLFPEMVKGRKVLGAVGGALITKAAVEEAKKRGLFILRLKNRKLIVQNAKNPLPVAVAK